ncbi:MAG TPA: transglycosylase SLT domain-containing protein [Solirubrobacterales bacterium]
MKQAPLVLATSLGDAPGGPALAAALAFALARDGSAIWARPGAEAPRPTLLASRAARELEARLREAGWQAAARGAICELRLPDDEPAEALARARADCGGAALVAWLGERDWRAAVEHHELAADGALIRAERDRDRALTALLAIELRARRISPHVVMAAPGAVGTRRALAGIDPGGPLARRAERIAARIRGPKRGRALRPRAAEPVGEAGQALPAVLAAAGAIIVVALVLSLLAAAGTGASRLQRAADLAAISAARSLRDDHPRLFEPARLPDGSPNPRHLGVREYERRAGAAARLALERNGVPPQRAAVSFPGADPPTRVRVVVRGTAAAPGSTEDPIEARAAATAEAFPVPAPPATGAANRAASGGGYAGPLAYRSGEGMRPDVARAYDALRAAAARAGHALYVNSGYRSDAEQARLFAANPDPRWVAPPGRSLHRCGTELDLGPPSAYGWLARNASRFGFVVRYPWEPWHLGYVAGPEPCSEAADRLAAEPEARRRDLPAFVPPRFRAPLARAAARHGVSAPLLAAQLMAESGFNPLAVSPAGARGIAQFMPATAAAYGLQDPFDPVASIDAQARLMADLLRRFGSTELALAAYNAGPAAVAACSCIPPYPETQAYVARIMGMLGGAGLAPPPVLEVRLVA